jgi:predicted nucleic acid-binding protein
VIDASVGIKQFIPDPLSDKVKQLFSYLSQSNTEFFVPDLFYIESTNIIWKYVRAGLYSITDVPQDLAELKSLSLQVMATAELMEDAFAIAHNHQISAYDGAYVALSDKVKAPLLTLDRKLFNALANSTYDVQFFADFSLPS